MTATLTSTDLDHDRCQRCGEALGAPPSEWQPIETAPKDGTPFLAWCPIVKGLGDSDATPDGDMRVIWWETRGQFTSDRDCGNEDFTKWMPLHAPPTDQKERGRCPTCARTDAEHNDATVANCRDPWHADDFLRRPGQKEVMSNSAASAGQDNATPRPAHSPAGAELWMVHSYLPGEFCIARSGPNHYAWEPLVNAHSRKDAELIVNALNAYENAAPQVTDEMVERAAKAIHKDVCFRPWPCDLKPESCACRNEASAALTAALGKDAVAGA